MRIRAIRCTRDRPRGFTARANRAFLGRVVRYLSAEAGIRQFLDIGTGIPTAGNTHQVAQAIGRRHGRISRTKTTRSSDGPS